jgi:hypothetical protein
MAYNKSSIKVHRRNLTNVCQVPVVLQVPDGTKVTSRIPAFQELTEAEG